MNNRQFGTLILLNGIMILIMASIFQINFISGILLSGIIIGVIIGVTLKKIINGLKKAIASINFTKIIKFFRLEKFKKIFTFIEFIKFVIIIYALLALLNLFGKLYVASDYSCPDSSDCIKWRKFLENSDSAIVVAAFLFTIFSTFITIESKNQNK